MKRKILGLCGFIGTGKTTTGNILVKEFGFEAISFAGTLKDAVSSVFGWPRHLLEGDTEESRMFRETLDEWWTKKLNINILPREVLQKVGTEVFRMNFHPDIWIQSAMKKGLDKPDSNFVFTDTRFKNEIKAIKEIGGKIIWIQRGQLPDWFELAKRKPHLMSELFPTVHRSEWEWVSSGPFSNLLNHSSLEDLTKFIHNLIKKMEKNDEQISSKIDI